MVQAGRALCPPSPPPSFLFPLITKHPTPRPCQKSHPQAKAEAAAEVRAKLDGMYKTIDGLHRMREGILAELLAVQAGTGVLPDGGLPASYKGLSS